MRLSRDGVVAARLLALVLSVVCMGTRAEEALRISGNGSGRGGMEMLVEAFEADLPESHIEVLPPMGSTGAIKALMSRRIDIVVSSRPLTEAEAAEGHLMSVEYARTPFVLAVHKNLGVTALTGAQLVDLYASGAARFPNGKRARPVLRMADASGSRLLQQFAPAMGQALQDASVRRGMLHADTESEAADLVQRTPGAFAACTLALIESERRPLVALTIDGKVPTLENLVNGVYPYYKSLYLVIRADAGPMTLRFAKFVQSEAGQFVLRAHGHWVQ